MSKKNLMKRIKIFGKTVAPHVNLRCAERLAAVLGYACRKTEVQPSVVDFRNAEAFLKNLQLEISDAKIAQERRKSVKKAPKPKDELQELIEKQKKDMKETGHGTVDA